MTQLSAPFMLILRPQIAFLNVLIYIVCYSFFLDNGIMTTPKRRILSFVFAVLCLKGLRRDILSYFDHDRQNYL